MSLLRRVLPLLLVCALLVAGCGSKSSSNPSPSPGAPAVSTTSTGTSFAKTKFVIHAALAFGVFHRWIYKPFKRGDFSHPLSHKVAFVKGLIAAGFVYHEVKLALHDAKSSKLLSKVVLPLTAVGTSALAIKSALTHNKADPNAINSAESSITTVKSESSAAGQPIQETTQGAPAGL
jgi:hypothetical protein